MTSTIVPTSVPPISPPSHDVVFCSHYGCSLAGITLPLPPSKAGGDWIAAIRVSTGFIACVGDAIGHGRAAAPLGRLMRRAFHSAIGRGLTAPGDILHHMNRVLLAHRLLGCATVIHCDGSNIVIASSAAPEPLLWLNGALEPVGCSGMILGICENPGFTIARRHLPTGSCLVLYTDGISEAEHPITGELFSSGKLAAVLDPTRSAASNLLACIDAVFDHTSRQHDDMSLLLLQPPDDFPPAAANSFINTRPRAPINFSVPLPENGLGGSEIAHTVVTAF